MSVADGFVQLARDFADAEFAAWLCEDGDDRQYNDADYIVANVLGAENSEVWPRLSELVCRAYEIRWDELVRAWGSGLLHVDDYDEDGE